MKGTLDRGKFDISERNGRRFTSSQISKYPNFPISSRQPGFTLLELVIALLLVALLSGMIFTTAHSSLLLGNTVVKTQNEEMLQQAFFDFMENSLSSLPGNTRMELTVSDSGSHYLTDLTLQNVPLSFTWGGQERTAKAIRLSTVKRRSGFLDIVLSYYENEIIEDESGLQASDRLPATGLEPFAEIVLLSDVAYFEWRLLDGRTMEYQYDWDLPGRLPLQMELTCAFGASGAEMRQVFWIPPRQNPEVFMRQLQQGGGPGGGGRPGNPENPGAPSTPPGISIQPGVLPPIPGTQ
jgi:prepilin-type N-terminal cleavage/methylation domain-containing protein